MAHILRKLTSAFVLIGVALLTSSAYAGDFGVLRPFATDGCTGFPNGTPDDPNLWLECCVHHDLLYWAGGTGKQKLKADEFLFKCVSDKTNPVLAAFMFAGVTVGGTPFIKDPFRWGYGWPKLRGFTPLSEDELEQVQALTPQSIDQIVDQLSN